MLIDAREGCADQSIFKLAYWSALLKIALLGFGLSVADSSLAEQAAEGPKPDAAVTTTPKTTIYLIRHTEKQLDAGRDPELTEQGHARARNWARLLSDVSLDKVYSTDYIRTRDTAKPIAASQNISVQLYDPGSVDFEAFIKENLNSNVVVVGHSNTIPAFTNGLLGEKRYEELDESNYDSLFVVDIMGQLRNAKLLNVAAPKSNK